jgi:hypothetical protein
MQSARTPLTLLMRGAIKGWIVRSFPASRREGAAGSAPRLQTSAAQPLS